ncbi:hypothetical protein SDRG_15930 [Saprolegnia diclina VS20]|uniref:Uncharacterized protein n=1 Tax=Saprolegnia diclina (strain VS20) TaxID=1156394 RepID=T0R2D9_SAPDV|nr:hypothetical protein SDRG_15930 [Saprolegnia diclina VS20]EQC26193.1 hypothetical protein SDRG_15930 [Saprolegnia diclina VS20]|eukprot:XP_008620338.1 hypothetical protein SDRG_15930 [Saprolegnia diclina VS20]
MRHRFIDVRISARPIPPTDGQYAVQSSFLTALADLLVSIRRVNKLALRGVFKVRFPDEAAAALTAWIQATPLMSLTMKNVEEVSSARQLWAERTRVASLETRLGEDGGSTLWGHLTHLDVELLPRSQTSYVVERLVNSALVLLHARSSDVSQDTDGPDVQSFLDDDLSRLTRLTTLRLTKIHLSTTHCLTLALLLPRCSHLGLTSNKLHDVDVLALALFLRHAAHLETLMLVKQGFGDVGASALSTALMQTLGAKALGCLLAHHPRLATCRLQNNPLGANGVAVLLFAWTLSAFCDALQSTTTLNELGVSSVGNLGGFHRRRLLSTLQTLAWNPHLNGPINDARLHDLTTAVSHTQLKSLNCSIFG